MESGLPVPSMGPNLTVALNALSLLLLILGYRAIRARNVPRHMRLMVAALVSSALFLIVYLVHHAIGGSTHYPFRDWTYRLYLAVLVPHSILAALLIPFILRGVWLAARGHFQRHARLMKWVWPVWIYVSGTGILVYLMLYILPHVRGG